MASAPDLINLVDAIVRTVTARVYVADVPNRRDWIQWQGCTRSTIDLDLDLVEEETGVRCPTRVAELLEGTWHYDDQVRGRYRAVGPEVAELASVTGKHARLARTVLALVAQRVGAIANA